MVSSAMLVGSVSSVTEDQIDATVRDPHRLYSPSEETPEQRQQREEAYKILADHMNAADSVAPIVLDREESPGINSRSLLLPLSLSLASTFIFFLSCFHRVNRTANTVFT